MNRLLSRLLCVCVVASATQIGLAGADDEPLPMKPPPKVVVIEIKLVKVVKMTGGSITVQDGANLPREFPFTRGFVQLNTDRERPLGYFPHRISDIQVGDIVALRTDAEQGVERCDRVRIYRRPGGKVPPAVEFPDTPEELRWHTVANAEQDWEEKGIPIPKRYLDKNGRYLATNPPYPPVAPLPREVKP